MAVLMSDGGPGAKWMDVSRPNVRFTDITGHDTREVVTNSNGWGEFRCPGGLVSVWVQQ